MGILDNLQPTNRSYSCRLRTILNELETTDQQILEAAIQDVANWSASALSKALTARGIKIADTSISKHRDGNCSC